MPRMLSAWLPARNNVAHAAVWLEASRRFWHWARNLGGPGIVIAAIVDNSVIPTPGITDALTVVLAAQDKKLWPYYALMATVGALIGGCLTYRMARQGGKATLEKYVPKDKVDAIDRRFSKWGFGALAIAAVLPPPAPMTPFLLAAGAAKYPLKKFIAALALGRSVRFAILAFSGAEYGHEILRWFLKYGDVILYVLIGLCVLGGLYGLYWFLLRRRGKRREESHPRPRSKAA